jgi:Apea-like HEPN
MSEMNLQAALKTFESFLRETTVSDVGEPSFAESPFIMFSRNELTITLTGQEAERYSQAIHAIEQALGPDALISRAGISDLAADAFGAVASVHQPHGSPMYKETLKSAMQRFRDALHAKPDAWEVHIPISGVAHSELPFNVGRVSLWCANEHNLSDFKASILRAQSSSDFLDKSFQQTIAEGLRDRTVAHVEVLAIDANAASKAAHKLLQQTLDAVNFYADRDHYRMWLSMWSTDDKPFDREVVLRKKQGGCHIRNEEIGRQRTMPLRQAAEKRGFARLASLLAARNPTDLQDRVLTAVKWAGRARIESRAEERFLLYAIALETLLLGGKQDVELSYRLAIRGAHLLSGDDLQSRLLTEKQLRDLYALRSKIVHSGAITVSDTQLATLELYARIAIVTVLDREPFAKMLVESELEDWFRAQLLGKPTEQAPMSGNT